MTTTRRFTASLLGAALILSLTVLAPSAQAAPPELDELVPVYQELITDPTYIGLTMRLKGNLDNQRVVDAYLEHLPFSPRTLLKLQMELGRFEFIVPSLIDQWHERWIQLHPQKAEKLYGRTAVDSVLGLASAGAGEPAAQSPDTTVEKAGTVGTNRNAAYDFPALPEDYQGEIQVAVNHNDPSQLVAAANTWDTNCGTYGTQAIFYSSDGGTSWGYTCAPDDSAYAGLDCSALGGGTFGSDPAVTWNDNGEVFLEYMLLCYNGSYYYSIVVAKSTDGGANWSGQGVVIDSYDTGDLEDKNFYAIDNNAGSPYYGRHYTCWDRNNNEKSAYSTDNGATWTEVDLPGVGGTDLGCELAVEDDGTVHIVYNSLSCGFRNCSGEAKYYARSTDGGASWSTPQKLRDFNLVGFSNNNCPSAQDDRCVGPFGAIAVDNSGGACDGNLYVTFSDHDGSGVDSTDIWMIRSTDGGSTWSSAVRVNDDATSNIQFHPFLQVDQSTGAVVVSWHDARNDPTNAAVDYFLARSTDCGQSFEANIQVSQPSAEFANSTISYSNMSSTDNANYNPNQYGEYMGLAVHNGTAYLAWSDTRQYFPGNTADTQADNLGFATVTFGPPDTTPPAAPTGLTATGGEGQVSLDWGDNTETDLAGYTVYRSTTSGSGYASVGTSATSDFVDSVSAGTYYYVVTARDGAGNESAQSAEASATATDPPAATTMHVASIVVGTRNAGQGNKYAQATVTVVDAAGDPVSGATVTGTFSGNFTGSANGSTAADGTVLLEAGPKKGPSSFTFCVDSVSHASLTYDAGSNVESCDSN